MNIVRKKTRNAGKELRVPGNCDRGDRLQNKIVLPGVNSWDGDTSANSWKMASHAKIWEIEFQTEGIASAGILSA